MERRTVYFLMILLGLAEALFLWQVSSIADYFFFAVQLLFWGPAIALMIICFIPKVRMGVAPGTPSQVLSTMSHNFRIAQFRVVDKGQSFVVQGGTNHGIRIYAKPEGSNSSVLVRSDPTPTGWGVLLILLLFTYGIGTILYSLYIFLISQKFGLSTIPAMYKGPGETIIKGEPSKTRACLIDTLSEGYRLSSEAYESAKSNYEDNIILGALAGMISFVAVFVLAGVAMGGDFSSGAQIRTSLALALVVGVGIPLLSYVNLRRKWRAKLTSLGEWAEKLRSELAQEATSAAPGERQTSTFEVILEAAKEIPDWIRIRHKSGLFRNPVIWLAIVFLVIYGFELLFAATLSYGMDTAFRVTIGALSSALLLLGVGLYFYWRRKENAEARQISETWNRRADAIQRKMDEMIRDL